MRNLLLRAFTHQRPLIHVWAPEIDPSKGGIQAFSAFLLQALQKLKIGYTLLSLHSTPETLRGHTRAYGFGNWPPRLRYIAFSVTALAQAIRYAPDLIIATHLHLAAPALISYFTRLVPFWVVAHGIEAWKVRSMTCGHALAKAAQILAVSQYTKENLLAQRRLSQLNVALFPNTFHQEKFQIHPKAPYLLQRYQLNPANPILFTLGRLSHFEKYKGYDIVLHAVNLLRKRMPGIRYVLGGAGEDIHRIQALIDQLGLRSNVILTGFIPDSELCDHYNLCDIFVMPSQGEGFGIVFLEAMACGKPVIAGCRDGSVDALRGGELGILVDPNDAAKLAFRISQVLAGTHEHPLLSKPFELRRRVISEFGVEAFEGRLAKQLSKFLKLDAND